MSTGSRKPQSSPCSSHPVERECRVAHSININNNNHDDNDDTLLTDLFGSVISSDSDSEDSKNPTQPATITMHQEIPGLLISKASLTPAQQSQIISEINNANYFDPTKGRNQIMLFGNLPAFLNPIIDIGKAMLAKVGLLNDDDDDKPPLKKKMKMDKKKEERYPSRNKLPFDQMIGNHYSPGEGITPHIDLLKRFADGIIIASFKSSIVMEFQKVDDGDVSLLQSYKDVGEERSGKKVNVLLEPGDVVCLSGESRYGWTHGISKRMEDVVDDGVVVKRGERVSITLRRLLEEHHHQVHQIQNIPYKIPDTQNTYQQLDIYIPISSPSSSTTSTPPPTQPKPWLIYLHGGAWRTGHRSDFAIKIGHSFAKRGIPTAIIGYRLSVTDKTTGVTDIQHPEHVKDVAAGLAYLISVSSGALKLSDQNEVSTALTQHPIEKFYIMGHSAGAQLGYLLFLQEKYMCNALQDLKVDLGIVNWKCRIGGMIGVE
ncbi:hypothetical protein HDU76_004388, partial [Blyttiomyces sp. JEL0837]